ncbi:hypothetical protein D9M71_131070 [compost metagenome]
MQRKHGIARKALEQTIVDHCLGPAQAFFVRLEDQGQGTVQMLAGRQAAGRRQQDCRMPIVATGMHAPGNLAGMGETVLFLHRQCVHVGAHADALATLAATQHPDHTVPTDIAVDLVAPLFQFAGDHGRGVGGI